MQRINSNRNLIIFGISVLALYAHLTIGTQIAISLIYVWYFVLTMLVLFGILFLLYTIRVLITRWQVQITEAQIAIAKATKEKRDVRTFPQGEQVFHLGIDRDEVNHALHLNPSPYTNGRYEQPTQQQMAIFTQYHTTNQQNNYYGQEVEIDNPIPMLESGTGWLDNLITTSPHIHICGPTTSGKTTLGKYLIERMAQSNSEFYLINPKHVNFRQQWPVEPIAKSIDTSLDALEKLVSMLQSRIEDESYNPDSANSVIIIVDEWDWIYEHYKRDAVSLLRRLIKVGAELNYKVLLVGQSSLSQDTGLSGSDYHNMVRIALWAAGEKLINSLPMALKDKAPLKAQIMHFKALPENIRYGVIVPLNNQPEVKIIPNLVTNDQFLIAAPQIEEAPIDEKELEVLEILENGGSLREAARFLTGKEQHLINSSDTEKVKKIAAKYNI